MLVCINAYAGWCSHLTSVGCFPSCHHTHVSPSSAQHVTLYVAQYSTCYMTNDYTAHSVQLLIQYSIRDQGAKVMGMGLQ
jgi:hypothetical protein